ncbi:hypothetical protein SAMN02745121_00243 [Nannocystis exedens]|uniref:Uncharacterized protein n=1 Tax=Nannocystis exedens TaxID=54 RepID=A0A1I1SSU3_9BACT|nr:hypothetical protein NAEX_08815 [Nannocystis exedens]SFD49486.1 hypothetical protein SAMN02745121_00243 [Nannocystis exedens]
MWQVVVSRVSIARRSAGPSMTTWARNAEVVSGVAKPRIVFGGSDKSGLSEPSPNYRSP